MLSFITGLIPSSILGKIHYILYTLLVSVILFLSIGYHFKSSEVKELADDKSKLETQLVIKNTEIQGLEASIAIQNSEIEKMKLDLKNGVNTIIEYKDKVIVKYVTKVDNNASCQDQLTEINRLFSIFNSSGNK